MGSQRPVLASRAAHPTLLICFVSLLLALVNRMPPLRQKGPAWDHVEHVDGDLYRCVYCQKEYVASCWRIDGHVAAIPGRGIVPCTNVPLDVLEQYKIKADSAKKTAAKKRTIDNFLQMSAATPGSSASTSSQAKQVRYVACCLL